MRRILITTTLAVSALLLAGCAPLGSSISGAQPDMVAPQAPSFVGEGSDSGGSVSEGAPSVRGPQIITTVQLTVTVKKPLSAADDASDIADRFGGSVAYRTENAGTAESPGSAQLTLRIPASKLTQALDELKKLGVAQNTSINAVDVTDQATDLDARITSLQTSVDRLLTLMSQATSTENLLAVENALSQRQADLESLQAQKRYLDDQVQLSTINLNLISERDTPATTPDTFWTGLVAGWNAFVGFWAGVLVALGVLVPWIIAAGIVTAIVLIWVKLARRRHAAKAGEESGQTPQSTPV